MRNPSEDAILRLEAVRNELVNWAVEHAYPWWSAHGLDSGGGGFLEGFSHDGTPVDRPRRARTHPRQTYCFALAPSLGWDGPADAIVAAALPGFEARFRRPDGLVRTLVGADGRPLDDSVVLYDQAFALFAQAVCARRLGRPDLIDAADRHLNVMTALLRHPSAGFHDDLGHSPKLFSNPHMHLLEAAMVAIEAGGSEAWTALARELVELALSRLIDPVSGGIREYFKADWSACDGVDGQIVEPGHQYEWAWLLLRWSGMSGETKAVAPALRMIALAEEAGVDRQRGVAINAILVDKSVLDAKARLWPQTERIKAGVAAGLATSDPAYLDIAAEAARALQLYFAGTRPGLWRDMLEPDGAFSDDYAPASSFYHIVCAIAELDAGVRRLRQASSADGL